MSCYEHDFVSTHCINCHGYLGDVCQNCGYLYDGGDYIASLPDYWCNCSDSVSDYDAIDGWDDDQ
jgi:hypothetical protein